MTFISINTYPGLSFTTSKFQNKNEGSSTAPSKSDQETEPSVAFSIEYEGITFFS